MVNNKAKKIVFLDRDGVINQKAPDHQYITKVSDFIFNEGIFEVVLHLKDRGFEFIVITNQRGIARGLYTVDDVNTIHSFMRQGFYDNGIDILDIFYCPHEQNTCDCRKPKPGMLEQACTKYPINLRESILISDSSEDVLMGEIFGIGKNILISHDNPTEALPLTKECIVLA
jgi:D-glycero-D-manno-heptose 1,7-bisphosphate phosphatase